MWLPMFLLAVMASGSACPDFCECRSPVIECHGRVPKLAQLDELPVHFTELKIRNVEQDELGPYVGVVPNSTFLRGLQLIEVTNCSSLTDQRYLRWDLPRGGEPSSAPVIPNVKSLNISHNGLKSIPDRCALSKENIRSELRVLDAGHNRIDSVPLNYCRHMFQLTWLSLAGNRLYFISPSNLRYLKSLEYLDLSDNGLQTLDKVFNSLASLQRLSVAGNKLEHVQANWFQNLGKLVELDVSRNKLTFISAEALRPLASLSALKLAENPLIERDLSLLLCTGRRLETVDASRLGLVRIPAALTRSVKILKLAGNQLTSIYSGDLDSYPLLRLLDLSGNRLMIIEEDALGRLDSLEELMLSGNILLAVPKSLPSGLLKLDLRQNAISKLRANDLQGIDVLRELLLSGNVISVIEDGSFRQMPALQVLDISDNPIKILPSDTLSGPSNLLTLRMSGLVWLETLANQNQDTAFPFLTPERLVALDISRSPILCGQLLADNAALSACKSLQELDLSYTNISTMRSDLAYVLPQLRKLNIIGNEWNCTEDQYWLGQWIRDHDSSINCSTRCAAPRRLEGKLLQEMPGETTTTTTTTTTTRTTTTRTTTTRTTTTRQRTSTLDVNYSTVTTAVYGSRPSTTTMFPGSKNVTGHSNTTKNFSASTFAPSRLNVSSTSEPIVTTSRGLENGSSVTYTTKFRAPDVTSSSEKDRTSQSTPRENYPSEIAKHDPRKYSTRAELIESNPSDKSQPEALPTDGDKKVTDHMVVTVAMSQENERRTTPGPTKAAYDRIKDARTNGHEEDEKGLSIFHKESANSISDLSRSKLLIANEEGRIGNEVMPSFAEKLNGQATDSGTRSPESMVSGAHPGMLILLGAAIGAAAALTVVLSRRATLRRRRDRQYHRHENIEVHALTPTTELW